MQTTAYHLRRTLGLSCGTAATSIFSKGFSFVVPLIGPYSPTDYADFVKLGLCGIQEGREHAGY